MEEYLRRYGLPHVEDSSNGTDDFLRNRLRHRVIPELEERAPGVSGRFPATAARLRRDDGLLEELAGPLWRQARREGEDLILSFTQGGMMQAEVEGTVSTPSEGWTMTRTGENTLFTKFGEAQELVLHLWE